MKRTAAATPRRTSERQTVPWSSTVTPIQMFSGHGSIGQLEHKLIKPKRREPRIAQTDNLQVNVTAGQAKDRSV
jgi:hypothetical protein